MSLDNENVDGTEESQDSGTESISTPDYRSEFEELKKQNAELISKMGKLLTPKEEPKKTMTPEEYDALLKSNPQAAIEFAIENKVNQKAQIMEHNMTTRTQQLHWDAQAEKDFPLLAKDKQFQALVGQETKQLLADGMSKDSPKLVYKAAEIAALKYKGAQETKESQKGSVSSEAPNNVGKQSNRPKNLPKNFDKWSNMFGLNKSAQERAMRIIKEKEEAKKRGDE